jgi:phosphatidylinositol-3-phosphatase
MRRHRLPRPRALLGPLLALALVAGCTSTSPAPGEQASRSAAPTTRPAGTATATADTRPVAAPCAGAAAPARYDHVLWIWFENKAPVVGSADAPYFTALAGQCGLATNYHGITHPSLPNYLAATGGSTFGVTDDAAPSAHPIDGPSIFGQVKAAGGQWRSYQESAPGRCALTSSDRYAVRHNPAAYFTGIRGDCRAWSVPLGSASAGALAQDLSRSRLGAFSFVTPDLCNDMHDCPVSTGDRWLKAWLPRILASPAYRAGRTAVVVTFDEDDRTAGNRVSTIVVAPSVRPGTTSGAPFTHYSLLRTTEQLLGLPTTLGNASTAASMRSAFHL